MRSIANFKQRVLNRFENLSSGAHFEQVEDRVLLSATIFSQDFNSLSDSASFTEDSFPLSSDDAQLTNSGSQNSDPNMGLTFATYWTDTRGFSGPVAFFEGPDGIDAIGVSSYTGINGPDISADGTPFASGVEHHFVVNEGNGLVSIIFDAIDLDAFTNRTLSMDYWFEVSPDYAPGDRFDLSINDGVNTEVLLDLGQTEIEISAKPDTPDTTWNSLFVNLEPFFESGFGELFNIRIDIDIALGANMFIDNVEICGDPEIALPEINGDENDNNIIGTSTGEVINGNGGDDTINGRGGDDILNGGEGDDEIRGGGGDDTLNGGPGNDTLQAGRGEDVLNGGEGDDVLRGAKGDDDLNGDSGSDWLRAGTGFDSMSGGSDNDYFVFGNNLLKINIDDMDVMDSINNQTIIEDFEIGVDHIVIQNGLIKNHENADVDNTVQDFNFDDIIMIATEFDADGDGNSDTVLTFLSSSGDNLIILSDIALADLSADDFIFGGQTGATRFQSGTGVYA